MRPFRAMQQQMMSECERLSVSMATSNIHSPPPPPLRIPLLSQLSWVVARDGGGDDYLSETMQQRGGGITGSSSLGCEGWKQRGEERGKSTNN